MFAFCKLIDIQRICNFRHYHLQWSMCETCMFQIFSNCATDWSTLGFLNMIAKDTQTGNGVHVKPAIEYSSSPGSQSIRRRLRCLTVSCMFQFARNFVACRVDNVPRIVEMTVIRLKITSTPSCHRRGAAVAIAPTRQPLCVSTLVSTRAQGASSHRPAVLPSHRPIDAVASILLRQRSGISTLVLEGSR